MKVLCVGSNYARHVGEMAAPAPTEPVWFWKPESAIIHDGQAIVLPQGVGAVHHEVELALRIGTRARRVAAGDGRRFLDAFTVAVDVTARDLQAQAKREGRPWARAKGFDTFLPLGAWQEAGGVDLGGMRLRLAVDGVVRQRGSTGDMTWDPARLVEAASAWTTLEPGDILLTGTPEGVGPLDAGQVVESSVEGHVTMTNPVTMQ